MDTIRVDVKQSVYAFNDAAAAELRRNFADDGVFCVNVLGSPGTGKTSVILRLFERLPQTRLVIEGDIEGDVDALKMAEYGAKTVQINTAGACHLDAFFVRQAYEKLRTDRSETGAVLFIENIGNLVCPAEFDVGEHAKLLISNVTEGDDKPAKYPLAFEKAGAILVNKTDLIPYVSFDMEKFIRSVKEINPTAPIFPVSAKTGEGFDDVAAWLTECIGK